MQTPATPLVSGTWSLVGVPRIYVEAGHVVTEFAAVSLSVVYITMTMKKTFMVTKLTTEPAAIHGSSIVCLWKKEKTFSILFFHFSGVFTRLNVSRVGWEELLVTSLCVKSLKFPSSLTALCQPASRGLARAEGQLVSAGSEWPRC